ncbi:terpene synthase 5 [Ricinus communis]|uniref:terpene synthase 5 n=1 Tax=Ricinus communis TaxID=3988 RepID=UPI00022CCE7A|nr:terpene synthase 5 [Ricinus communis]AEQ27767.1 sesquiterpene synthase [Ricinus communis]|eukprot:NP_001310688.1 terpene synthase 5 [Ricinus communis]
MATEGLLSAETDQDVARFLANFPPTEWGYSFASLLPQDSEFESHTKELDLVKEKVKDMLMQSRKELTENIEFVNCLCRLGVSYHFESEIIEQLSHIFISLPKILEENDYSLYILTLLFRVLRQHGYKMPCDVFNKFKDSNGEFKKCMTADVRGLLSLYEATFLSVHGEDILDEALAFTRQHLETLAEKSSPHLARHIRNALHLPFHHAPERLEILQYICFYEGEKSMNETLLKFAKLDFNRLQLLYRKELGLLSRWWKDINLTEKLPYTRDRIVEAYAWAAGIIIDPQFSRARLQFAKHLILISVMDDTYDSYGTFDELKHFTAALQRFTFEPTTELPEYMKFLYNILWNFFQETEKDETQGCACKTSFAREMLKEVARSYFAEAEWYNDGVLPTFDEFMQFGLVSSTFDYHASAFFLGVEDLGMKEIIWLRDNPTIAKTAKLFGRLFNDIAIREDEQKKGDYPSAIKCYMNDHDVSLEKAKEDILKMLEDGWKDMNEELMKPTIVPKILTKFSINFARMSDFSYRGGIDKYTCGTELKESVKKLTIFPLQI